MAVATHCWLGDVSTAARLCPLPVLVKSRPCCICTQELEAARRLPRGVQELGEEDMGRLAAASRAAGLEPLFLTALKLGGGGGGGGGTRCLDVG